MSRNPATLIILLLLSALPIPFVAAQTDKKTSVSLIYEAIAATNATLWLAEDARLLKNTASTPRLSTRAALCRYRRW